MNPQILAKQNLEAAYALMCEIQQQIGRLYYMIEDQVNPYLAPEVHKLDVETNAFAPPMLRIKVI